ncbi:RNA polymerase sigma factor [Catalinimonas sp. 4WD22]|uniref:RNA polymerase sigma factor n=1 Tax=Catalinimonas locisalis TaxID=3133978 RepID=UPI003100CADA
MKQGNGQALVQLYDLHVDLLSNYGRKFTNKSEIIEDAIQDLLTEIWVKKEKLSQPTSIKAYLLKAFRQKLLRQLSKYKRISYLEDYTQLVYCDEVPNFQQDENSDQVQSFKLQLEKALATLSPKQREAIMLRYSENLTYDEIAEIMNVKKQSLYNLLHEAILKLSKVMKPERRHTILYLFVMLALFCISVVVIY